MMDLSKLIELWESKKFPQTSLFISSDVEEALKKATDFAAHIFRTETRVSIENNTDFHLIRLLETEDSVHKEITIDQIRKASDFLSKTAALAKTKILVIYQADLMNMNSANAALKMLEEPNQNNYIILISHYAASLLPTIRSRCCIFNLDSDLKESGIEEYNFFEKKDIDEVFKMAASLALKKNQSMWQDFSISALNCLSELIKISSGVIRNQNVQLAPTHYLIHQYNRVKEIIDNTNLYELDKKQSAIMIYDLIFLAKN